MAADSGEKPFLSAWHYNCLFSSVTPPSLSYVHTSHNISSPFALALRAGAHRGTLAASIHFPFFLQALVSRREIRILANLIHLLLSSADLVTL